MADPLCKKKPAAATRPALDPKLISAIVAETIRQYDAMLKAPKPKRKRGK